MHIKRWLASFELLLAAAIWGFGFTATIWALKSFDSISLAVIRFTLAFFIGFLILRIKLIKKSESDLNSFKLSFFPGIFLGLTLALQTWGLETTSATNSGFITTLYAFIVPILERYVFKKKLPPFHLFWVMIALFGTALMVDVRLGQINPGDLKTLACAVFASFQIIYIGRISHKIVSPFAFNVYQSLWAAVACLLFWPVYGHFKYIQPDALVIWGVVALTLGSTLFAFVLQVRAQKVLSPSVSSLIFLLESPFATLFAVLLLAEKIVMNQILGATLIFLAAIGATLFEKIKTKLKRNV